MIKSLRLYMLIACSTLCLAGCAKTEEAPTTETQDIQQEETVLEEVVYHPIQEGSVDYLSVKGIELEPATEIAMVATNADNKFWDAVKAGAQAAISDFNTELGYTGKDKISLTFTAPKNEDVVEQINIIDQFLDKAPDALCIAFTDASACKTQMQMAKNNGIKLITFDTQDDTQLTEAYVGTDDKAAAAESAAKLFEAIDYEGKVAIIVHNALTQSAQHRKQAFVDELASNYNDKNIQFVEIVYLAQDDRTPEQILDKMLERTPDLDGIICTDLMTTEMVLDYVDGLDSREFVIAGFDTSKEILAAVEDGTLIGTVSQNPYGIGYATVTTAARAITGQEKSEVVDTGHMWVDADNLYTEEVQSLVNY